MYKVVLLAFFASASAFVVVNSPCPEIKTVDNFDFDAFAQGKWYEISAYPIMKRSNKCSHSVYTHEGDSVKISNHEYIDGKLHTGEGSVRPDPNVSGRLIYTLPHGPSNTLTDSEFNVLASDNKNYVLGYYCRYDEKKGSRIDLTWLFARSKTLTKEIETDVDNYINSSGFLDKSKFVKIDFNDEICKDV